MKTSEAMTALQKVYIVQMRRREVAEDSDPDCTKQVKHTTNTRQSGRLQAHATKVYHTTEFKRQAERKERFLPGPKASRIRVQNPIVIMMYGIWYREERSEEKAERSEEL